MKAPEINKQVVAIAHKYGLALESLSEDTHFYIIFIGEKMTYNCRVLDADKKTFIESGHHPGYNAMLKAFENNIRHHQIIYSTKKQEIYLP